MSDVKKLELVVLKARQPIGDFYIGSIQAKDLVDISFSDVRRLVKDERDIEMYLGIQRPVNPKRIREIKQYIQGDDATFPTSIILAIDERCAEYQDLGNGTGKLILTPYKPTADIDDEVIEYEQIAKVIDGQHRIAAFIDENNQWAFNFKNMPFDINVAIFIGADISEQANIFATVNLAQTKVNRSLVYDLTELAKTRSPYKSCHNIAVALDKQKGSPFYKRIKRLGVATPERINETLTQASFVESLIQFISPNPIADRNKLLNGNEIALASRNELQNFPFRNLFLSEKDVDIAEIIYNFFKAVEKKWPTSWQETGKKGNILPRSNAFKAFMVYLRQDLYPELVNNDFGKIPTIDEFYQALNHIHAVDSDFTTSNFSPGSGGQSTFLKMLRGQVTIEDMQKN